MYEEGIASERPTPRKKLLSEIIEALNELFDAETSDEDKLHYARGWSFAIVHL
ncbi:MAG: hypothetical protein PF508_01705 [Spirochaeta sp.]|jgi:hypothetical protein|nr:hypothetical protein [Spirochaeta sp.]